jgi:hypothetical protein
MQFPMDISVMDTGKYRKLVLTGEIYRPSPGALVRIYVGGLEITYLLMYSWTRPHRRRFRNKRYNATLFRSSQTLLYSLSPSFYSYKQQQFLHRFSAAPDRYEGRAKWSPDVSRGEHPSHLFRGLTT